MSADYIESLFQQYRQNRQSVPDQWRGYFAAVEELSPALEAAEKKLKESGKGRPETTSVPGGHETVGEAATAQNAVTRLIQAYRYHGHRHAHVNPLAEAPKLGDELSLEEHEIPAAKLDDIFATAGVLPQSHASLRTILTALKATYCGTLALQLGGLSSLEERIWLREKMEETQAHPPLDKAEKLRIYQNLMAANGLEKFLHHKFVGVKRFSIEGGDALMPMLDTLVNDAGAANVADIVFGMAHRGRLNVLVNMMGKPMTEIFAQFLEKARLRDSSSSGDVKYHFGHACDLNTPSGNKVHVSLLNNPSHLEAVNPVVMGSTRAKQMRHAEGGEKKVLPLLIHGDAAFAGQGVVPETLNLANLKGYSVGGTVHIVINNQVGFTACPEETFSGEYCTDIARVLQCPIFHVNGDDPEACVYATRLAFAYRQQFGKDAVIDLICYRRHGHNEGDDPAFTQPKMYSKIKPHPVPDALYRQRLLEEKSVTAADLTPLEEDYSSRLNEAYTKAQEGLELDIDTFHSTWTGFEKNLKKEPQTSVKKDFLKNLSEVTSTYPDDFSPNRKVKKVLDQRAEMWRGKAPLNWGAGEVAAYATLLAEGYGVRLSGQDVQRGTFSHRHVLVKDSITSRRHAPIASVAADGAKLEVYNSCLSELAVMGFEYGHALAAPKTLTIWEGQFGDFANGAQIMIDQFVSSGEVKWSRMNGLVLLLPHGQEGQGPEHSSARLERYLQLCGDDNWSVCVPSTPAQMFHLLRRQMLRNIRKPLVVMTPKSLLRHPKAVSDVADLTGKTSFQPVVPDTDMTPKDVRRVVLCSGKLYYELAAHRTAHHRKDVAIVRLEEVYPLPVQALEKELKKYKTDDIVWTQEEPRNQGAWTFLLDNLWPKLGLQPRYIGRGPSASTAVGSPSRFREEQEQVITKVFE